MDVIASLPQDYLGSDHTLEHMAAEMAPAFLATPKPYEEWRADGAPDVVTLAGQRMAKTDPASDSTPLDVAQRRNLDAWVKERRKALG